MQSVGRPVRGLQCWNASLHNVDAILESSCACSSPILKRVNTHHSQTKAGQLGPPSSSQSFSTAFSVSHAGEAFRTTFFGRRINKHEALASPSHLLSWAGESEDAVKGNPMSAGISTRLVQTESVRYEATRSLGPRRLSARVRLRSSAVASCADVVERRS